MKKQIITFGLIVGLVSTLGARTLEEAVSVCEAGNAEMCIGLGKDFKKRNQVDKAQKYIQKGLEILKAECKKDNPNAYFSFARLYARGDVIKENKKEAKKLFDKSSNIFKKACNKGDENSCMMVEKVQMHIEML